MGQKWSALPVPHAIEVPDRAPKERYYDPDFFAARGRAAVAPGLADGVPARGDPASRATSSTYEILDQSVIVLRADDGEVRAFQNACRHRGVTARRGPGHLRAAASPARSTAGATASTAPTPTSRMRKSFDEHNLQPGDIDLTPVRCELWGGVRVDQPRRRRAAAAAVHRAGRHHPRRVEGRVAAHRVVVRLPPARELEARRSRRSRSSTTWCRRIRSSSSPACGTARDGATFDPRVFVDAEIQYLRTMSEGMAGMVHANDVRVAEGLRDIELPADPEQAMATWNRTLNDAVVGLAPGRGQRHPRPQRARGARGSTSRWATASRTTSCCPCTAARRPTGSARSDRRRR